MIKKLIICILFTTCVLNMVHAQTIYKDRNLLTKSVAQSELINVMPAHGDWKPYPALHEREKWEAVPASVRDSIIDFANALLGSDYKTVSATSYLEYVRSGRRSGGGGGYNRSKLRQMILAEIFENKGRYIDEIINGVWAICEESSWVGSAHLHMQNDGHGLPNVNEPVVDLSVGVTVNLLAWVEYFFGEKLDAVSPLIRQRMYLEVQKRMLQPCLERNDFWWMGNGPYLINNWNPWICSNWMMAILIFEKDTEKRMEASWKCFQIVDKFINSYPDDGGCDEGPSYWFHAGGKLFDFLEILYSATNQKIDVYADTVIKEIARYPYRVHISENQFVNFADAASKTNMVYYNVETLFHYGKRINDSVLMAFAASFVNHSDLSLLIKRKSSMYRFLKYLLTMDEINSYNGSLPYPESFYFEGREVLVSRDKEGSADGFFIAVKGGHNNESHNHNDVGNFIMYYNGNPVIIDVGVGKYTAKTFSDQRYDIWTMQSRYHNCPTINGVMQQHGEQYKADDVVYTHEPGKLTYSLNIASAYPDEAAVKSWERTITHVKGKSISISEKFKLNIIEDTTYLTLMFLQKPEIEENGIIALQIPGNDKEKIVFRFDSKRWKPEIESIRLEDDSLMKYWGNYLYQLKLTYQKKSKSDKTTFLINLNTIP